MHQLVVLVQSPSRGLEHRSGPWLFLYLSGSEEYIQVAVRIRPFLQRNEERHERNILSVEDGGSGHRAREPWALVVELSFRLLVWGCSKE